MTDRELVSEIKTRFKFAARDIRNGLASYELNLIYDKFPEEAPERIRDTLERYSQGKLKVTKINSSVKSRRIKSIHRGVVQGRLVV